MRDIKYRENSKREIYYPITQLPPEDAFGNIDNDIL